MTVMLQRMLAGLAVIVVLLAIADGVLWSRGPHDILNVCAQWVQSIDTTFSQAVLAPTPQRIFCAEVQLVLALGVAALWAWCAYILFCSALNACVRMLVFCLSGGGSRR